MAKPKVRQRQGVAHPSSFRLGGKSREQKEVGEEGDPSPADCSRVSLTDSSANLHRHTQDVFFNKEQFLGEIKFPEHTSGYFKEVKFRDGSGVLSWVYIMTSRGWIAWSGYDNGCLSEGNQLVGHNCQTG